MKKSTNNATATTNATKTNNVLNCDELFDILSNTINNKNALTIALNAHGYIANMKSKNANDVTTVNNDLYYQLFDGSRVFFGTSKKTVQLWLTDDFYKNRKSIIPSINDREISSCNDSIRHYKTLKNIPFTREWFTDFITRYNALYAVRLVDIATATK